MLGNLDSPLPHVMLTALDVPSNTTTIKFLKDLLRGIRHQPGTAEVTIALGSSWFDKTEPAVPRPAGLTPMPTFIGDVLDPALIHGDLLMHVAGRTLTTTQQVTADLLTATRRNGIRWQKRGHRPENRTQDGRSLTRNLFGFVEGHSNPPLPDHATAEEVALIGPGTTEPNWTIGGTYLALRIIQFAQEFWDAEPLNVQQQVIGRRRDGGWLDGTAPTRQPSFISDPAGHITPLNSHVRRANPRTPGTETPRLVRRGYSYDDGPDAQGHARTGLLFIALQADIERGFAGVQRRLAGQDLDHYALAVGGGYFFAPDFRRGFPW